MTLAFGYIRRSSYKQQDNNSVEIQKSHIIEFANKKGLTVPEEFIIIEDVTSAFKKRASQRKELMRLKSLMVETKITNVIFYEESRMDRTAYTFVLDFYRPLKEELSDIAIYTTNSEEPFDPENEQNKIAFLLYRQESEIKSNRAVGNLIAHLESTEKKRPGSKVPYGYNQVNNLLSPNENAEVVMFIYYLHSWGVSMSKIATTLNEADILSPSGKAWRSSTIENILKNPVYTGTLHWEVQKSNDKKSYKFPDNHEPLIDNHLKRISEINVDLQKRFGRLDTPFLFLNKLSCSDCHNVLTSQNGSTKRNGIYYSYQYYVCKCCNYKIEIEELHKQLFPDIFKHIQSFNTNDELIEASKNHLLNINHSIQDNIENHKKNIDKARAKGCIAEEEGDTELKQLADNLVMRLERTVDDLGLYSDAVHEMSGTFESGDFLLRFSACLNAKLSITEKRLMILYFVQDVTISPVKAPRIHFSENLFEQLFPLDKLPKQ
ncbi:recombinase family protein [Rossellomorea vietnamensis]|uniref:recombinase family protein n=1 Tax=Rossellomorea vietnamensis TaxID=218284 RepID=UPI003D29E232